ncbi:hypothetical protein Pan161_29110 [Gimesia algae]|uniref:Uncharacterized protein n=1 Tax=Gimesia algae TaxID=2527971 RepID=A0A517VE31_9PLAN|nr:hypothetical protein Pan161_29110 [Gimesia algae]
MDEYLLIVKSEIRTVNFFLDETAAHGLFTQPPAKDQLFPL